MTDPFFTQKICSRCTSHLGTRTMSWFTDEAICMDCAGDENEIKNRLRAKGIKDAMEGCGFVPNPDEVKAIH